VENTIKRNAELVIQQMSQVCGFTFGYDLQSVAWLDGYIERQRARAEITDKVVDGLINVFGSYLGECVIQNFGGRWENEEGQWRVSFDEQNAVYPFAKVAKQFQNGSEDSIKSFFEVIPLIFTTAGQSDKRNKPRWRFW
jgi:hypothetical protein